MPATSSLLLDTNVLIDYLRGKKEAVDFISHLTERFFVSAITVAELYAGVREGAERTQLNAFISAFDVIEIDAALAAAGGLLRRDYGKSHGTGIGDALIAASALSRGLTLVTLNLKHFPMLTGVVVPY